MYANRLFRNHYLEPQKTHIHSPDDGGIYGSVVLADGSKIPGAIVTITGNNIGVMNSVSSANCDFRFSSLPPGEYTIKIELEGFKTVIHKGVKVEWGKTVTLNIFMDTNILKEDTKIVDYRY